MMNKKFTLLSEVRNALVLGRRKQYLSDFSNSFMNSPSLPTGNDPFIGGICHSDNNENKPGTTMTASTHNKDQSEEKSKEAESSAILCSSCHAEIDQDPAIYPAEAETIKITKFCHEQNYLQSNEPNKLHEELLIKLQAAYTRLLAKSGVN